ncbi:hypothetical protein NC653_029301 [Populus alba x Populus x berolinensis]|uniref:Uncharacterized protein n=1 Tax=Populus alba x Populus x berolinensis TaxID=444605 RepID=A0AAD6M1Z8_9ROSI|nr:hypothetical protein NC653_029301 [Populus alba x Populus x berolinensis]
MGPENLTGWRGVADDKQLCWKTKYINSEEVDATIFHPATDEVSVVFHGLAMQSTWAGHGVELLGFLL